MPDLERHVPDAERVVRLALALTVAAGAAPVLPAGFARRAEGANRPGVVTCTGCGNASSYPRKFSFTKLV